MSVVYVVKTASKDVVNKPTVSVAYGPFQQVLPVLYLKCGVVVVAAQAILAATAVHSLLVEQVVTMLLRVSQQHQDVNIQFVLAEVGHVTTHTLV
jgi:hypothetical protein